MYASTCHHDGWATTGDLTELRKQIQSAFNLYTVAVGRYNDSSRWSHTRERAAMTGAVAPLMPRSAAALTRMAQKMRRTQINYVVAHVDMSAFPAKGQAQPPSTPQSSDDALGEVQDILAERTSTTLGCSEVLVTWKPSWIPITNMQDGPILRNFRAATKCYFLSNAGKLLLPVEPDTALADDIDAAAARTERQLELQAQRERGTPRKSLGSVAKRAAPSADTD